MNEADAIEQANNIIEHGICPCAFCQQRAKDVAGAYLAHVGHGDCRPDLMLDGICADCQRPHRCADMRCEASQLVPSATYATETAGKGDPSAVDGGAS